MGVGEVTLRSAVFVDRDGVINRNVLDPQTGHYGAPLRPEDFELVPGVISALVGLQNAGFLLFLVSNQPNYAKGKSTLEGLVAIHERMEAELRGGGVKFTEFYYCYHHPQGLVAGYAGRCDCRKPSPYFLLTASDAYGLSLADSWMVGDRASDIACGLAAGVKTIRVSEDHPAQRSAEEVAADFEVRDLREAATTILMKRGSELP